MFAPDVRAKIERELTQAKNARSAGNEGQARVCARRAAGAAIREFFLQTGKTIPSPSAIDLLHQLRECTGLPDRVYETVEHLLLRVNTEYQLPLPVDLIAETTWLIQELEIRGTARSLNDRS